MLCIHHEGPPALDADGLRIAVSRLRGFPLPLFTGAASLVILANLPSHKIKSYYLKHQLAVAKSGLGETWNDSRNSLANHKKVWVSTGMIDPHLVGIAVPILLPGQSEVLWEPHGGHPQVELLRYGPAKDAGAAADRSQGDGRAVLRTVRSRTARWSTSQAIGQVRDGAFGVR